MKLGDSQQEYLYVLAQELVPMPVDARERLEREAKHIQRIAEGEFGRCERQWEQDILDELRKTFEPGDGDKAHFQESLNSILEQVRLFCRCEYVVFFGTVGEGDTLLTPIAEVGIPKPIAQNLPHFNWRKAGFPLEQLGAQGEDIAHWTSMAKSKGFRGSNDKCFDEVSCIIATSLGGRYRGILVMGCLNETACTSRIASICRCSVRGYGEIP